jgi:hypothetical protein
MKVEQLVRDRRPYPRSFEVRASLSLEVYLFNILAKLMKALLISFPNVQAD